MMRSILFVPGDNARNMGRAAASAADALVYDWEDSVALEKKATARSMIGDALKDLPADKLAYIRVNQLDSPNFPLDLAALPLGRIAGIMLPKCRGRAHFEILEAKLAAAEKAAGVAEGATGIIGIVTETAQAMLALPTLDEPRPRMHGFVWGGEDLASDLGIRNNRDETGAYREVFRLARTMMMVAASACRTQAIDSVFTDFRDAKGLAEECRAAKADGFTAKAAIHPDQVALINELIGPNAADLEWAQRVCDALSDGRGVAVMDGKMIDIAHLRLAQRWLGLKVS
ncbi:MAG: HpcH/HpaI aldolase/citrate lyase family protein [Panacagrimonas sp.]